MPNDAARPKFKRLDRPFDLYRAYRESYNSCVSYSSGGRY